MRTGKLCSWSSMNAFASSRRLVDEAHDQVGLEAVAPLVDPGAVHREDQAGVRILLRDRGDRGAVEGEVEPHRHVEEVRGPPLRVEAGAALPDEPAVVVAACDGQQRLERLRPRRPFPRELPGKLAVLGLENDVPVTACVANEHAPPAGFGKRTTFLNYCGREASRSSEPRQLAQSGAQAFRTNGSCTSSESSHQTLFVCRYSSTPSMPFWRPMPLDL